MYQPEVSIWMDGQAVATISSFDRGLQYGDGFFTTILTVDQSLLNWTGHKWRLVQCAEQLRFPKIDESSLLQQIKQTIQQFDLNNLLDLNLISKIVKVIYTRGNGGYGYEIPAFSQVITQVQVSQTPMKAVVLDVTANHEPLNFKLVENMPINISLCRTQAAIQAQLAGLKHLNRLENVLARSEIVKAGYAEGLMLNGFNQVISGTQSNLFLIKDNQLITPLLNNSGVEGTTRFQLKKIAERLGFEYQETEVTLALLISAQSLFLSNAIRGIIPVKNLSYSTLKLQDTLMNTYKFSTVEVNKIHQSWSNWQVDHAYDLNCVAYFK